MAIPISFYNPRGTRARKKPTLRIAEERAIALISFHVKAGKDHPAYPLLFLLGH